MIVCQRCGKENQDHYKFCLGCGAEISPSGESVGMMKTMMADVGNAPTGLQGGGPMGPPPGVGFPTPPSGTAPQGGSHGHQGRPMGPGPMGGPPMGQPPAHMGQPPAPMGQPPSPMGHPPAPMGHPPAPMGQPPAHMGPMMGQPPSPQAAAGPKRCTNCGADIPPNFKFCGVCGTPVQETPPPQQPAQPNGPPMGVLKANMTLIRPDGNEGGRHDLREGKNPIGRDHGAIFESDGYLSPTHAELEINRNGMHRIRDLGSLNGIFVRMTEEEELRPGQIIRIGQELLRFELIDAPQPEPDGTEVMGSPNPGYWGRITVIIGDDVTGAAYPLLGDSITMGREHGDINFPDDGYVSGMHARLVTRDNKVFLSDMGSSNGTFMKVEGERAIPNNSYVLLGQQLFRISAE